MTEVSKKLSKFISSLGCAGNSLYVLSGLSSSVFPCSFTNIVGTPFGIASPSISLVFLISNGIAISESIGKKEISIENLIY